MQYPIVVRSSAGRAWSSVICAVMAAAFAIAAHVWNLGDPDMHAEGLTLAIAVGFTLAAVYVAVAMKVSALRLHADRVELAGVFRTSTRKLSDLRGLRAGTDDSLLLEAREGVRSLLLPRHYLRDPVLKAWVESLPNLDAQDAAAAEALLVQDARLGGTEDERRANLARLRRVGALLGLAAFALCGWMMFWPQPYRIAAYANLALPVLAFALVFWKPGLFTLVPRKTVEAHANLIGLIGLPGAALGVRALQDVYLVAWGPTLLAAAVIAGAALALAGVADEEARKKVGALLLGGVLLVWAWGGAMMLNVLLDDAPPRRVPATVIERRGEAHDEPSISVRAEGREYAGLDVPARRWETLREGSHVCLLEFPGRFGWRYLWVGGVCDGGPVLPVTPTGR